MSSPEKLLEATLNRLGIRIEQSLTKSAEKLSEIAKDAPKKLQEEWELFQEEVIAEVNRLEKESKEESSSPDQESNFSAIKDPKEKIKYVRKKLSEISRKLEASN